MIAETIREYMFAFLRIIGSTALIEFWFVNKISNLLFEKWIGFFFESIFGNAVINDLIDIGVRCETNLCLLLGVDV